MNYASKYGISWPVAQQSQNLSSSKFLLKLKHFLSLLVGFVDRSGHKLLTIGLFFFFLSSRSREFEPWILIQKFSVSVTRLTLQRRYNWHILRDINRTVRYTVSTGRYEAAKDLCPASRPEQASDKDGLVLAILLNPSNAVLNTTCHLLALLGTHLIFHVSGLKVKGILNI